MLGSVQTGMASVLTADGDNQGNASGGLVIPTDWTDYARYFILSKMPGMKSADLSIDFYDSQLDWTATANSNFPAGGPAGVVRMSTVFLAGAVGYANPKPPLNNSTDVFTSMLNMPWAVAARSNSLAAATTNSRHGFACCVQLGNGSGIHVGLSGADSLAFLSAWSTNGTNNKSNVLPAVTTIPFKGILQWHEVYVLYDGGSVDIYGGGDYRTGIEPFLGGQFLEMSIIGDVLCHPGISVQSVNGATTEQMESMTMLGKPILTP
jgi:hypothetical protein